MASHLNDLAYVYGRPTISGTVKKLPHDFVVQESLSFEPSGEGDHLYLYITKQSLNTHDVIQALSKHFSVSMKDIGYAGMKDKHAITSQWFSLPCIRMENIAEKIERFTSSSIEEITYNNKKLKRGVIKSNTFKLNVSDCVAATEQIDNVLSKIKVHGVPNYFTEQRFGVDDKNILRAEKIFKGEMRERNHQKRGLYYSAARSFIFNHMLSNRIDDDRWEHLQAGDIVMLRDSRSIFTVENVTADLEARLIENDLDITLPMTGVNGMACSGYQQQLIDSIIRDHHELYDGLCKAGLEQQQRRIRAIPEELCWHYEKTEKMLTLEFSLLSGSYATAILREIVTSLPV